MFNKTSLNPKEERMKIEKQQNNIVRYNKQTNTLLVNGESFENIFQNGKISDYMVGENARLVCRSKQNICTLGVTLGRTTVYGPLKRDPANGYYFINLKNDEVIEFNTNSFTYSPRIVSQPMNIQEPVVVEEPIKKRTRDPLEFPEEPEPTERAIRKAARSADVMDLSKFFGNVNVSGKLSFGKIKLSLKILNKIEKYLKR
jgi:hypothetical protein